MAMIDCPECSHRISDQSNSCPSCGFVTNKRIISVSTHQGRKPRKTPPKHYRLRDLGKPILCLFGLFLIFKLPTCFNSGSTEVSQVQESQQLEQSSPSTELVQIPMLLSGSGEDGRYFLISQTTENGIKNIEYIRKGNENDTYGKMQIKCSKNKIRKTSSDNSESLILSDLGDWYTPKPDWTDKDIFNYACT